MIAMPLGHLGVNLPDLVRAKKYYDTVMPLLGYETFLDRPDEFAYRRLTARSGPTSSSTRASTAASTRATGPGSSTSPSW